MIEIQITENHIKRGFMDNCRACPTAQAINEVLIPYAYAVVRRSRIFINTEKEILEFSCPIKVLQFIDSFDSGQPVEPMKFDLDIPESWLSR